MSSSRRRKRKHKSSSVPAREAPDDRTEQHQPSIQLDIESSGGEEVVESILGPPRFRQRWARASHLADDHHQLERAPPFDSSPHLLPATEQGEGRDGDGAHGAASVPTSLGSLPLIREPRPEFVRAWPTFYFEEGDVGGCEEP